MCSNFGFWLVFFFFVYFSLQYLALYSFSLLIFTSSSFHVALFLSVPAPSWVTHGLQLLRDVPLLQNRSFTGHQPL